MAPPQPSHVPKQQWRLRLLGTEKRRVLFSIQAPVQEGVPLVGKGPEHLQGTALEQGAEPTNAHTGPCDELNQGGPALARRGPSP